MVYWPIVPLGDAWRCSGMDDGMSCDVTFTPGDAPAENESDKTEHGELFFNVQRVSQRPAEEQIVRANEMGKVKYLLLTSERARFNATTPTAPHHGGVAFDPLALAVFVLSFGAGSVQDEYGGEGSTSILASTLDRHAESYISGQLAFAQMCHRVGGLLREKFDLSTLPNAPQTPIRWVAKGVAGKGSHLAHSWRIEPVAKDEALEAYALAHYKAAEYENVADYIKEVMTVPIVVPIVWHDLNNVSRVK